MGDSTDDIDSLTQELFQLRSERADHKAEALRLRALLAAVPDLIIRIHRDGTYLDFVGAKDIPVLVPREERIGKRVALTVRLPDGGELAFALYRGNY